MVIALMHTHINLWSTIYEFRNNESLSYLPVATELALKHPLSLSPLSLTLSLLITYHETHNNDNRTNKILNTICYKLFPYKIEERIPLVCIISFCLCTDSITDFHLLGACCTDSCLDRVTAPWLNGHSLLMECLTLTPILLTESWR